MCRPLGSNFRVVLNPLLQTLLSDQSPDAVEGARGCFSRLGCICLGAAFPSRWGHRSCTQKRVRFSHVLSPVFAQEADWALGGCTFPQLWLISLWQLKQDSGLEKGEGGDCQVGPGLACGLQESHE